MSGNFAIKGGGAVGRLMANTILNFHFDYLNPSLMLTPIKRSSQKLCKHFRATSVQQRELSCQITLGPRPCISRCLYSSPSCCHAPPPTMFFSSTTLAQSHISINFFLLSRSCLKGTVSRQSLKMASTWTLFFYIHQMVMITCIITKHFLSIAWSRFWNQMKCSQGFQWNVQMRTV